MPFFLDLRYRLEYVLLRGVIELVRLLPLDTAVALFATLLRKLASRGRRHRRALANLERAFPEKTAAEREQIALKMWENLGRVVAETMQLDRLLEEPERIEVVNAHIMRRYHGKMGSMICVSLHMGNWELTVLPVLQAGVAPAAVYRLVKNPYVDRYLRAMRKQLYPGGLFAKGRAGKHIRAGHQTARQLGSYVRQGGRLAFLADLYDAKGIAVPFFGHPAKSTPFPAMLARRTGSRIWIARCLRVGERSHFKIEVRELKVFWSDDAKKDIERITAAMQQQFEEWIREAPEQWAWSNRKWS